MFYTKNRLRRLLQTFVDGYDSQNILKRQFYEKNVSYSANTLKAFTLPELY